ncbi:hypothetical protein AGR4B_Lc70163 [Agrobacterium tumefaciens str. CFBP 5621]|nr:hypothetical protein AGR4B_Lc70163 [Agrobacterium tumefaciens str. CFBP 5621]
MASDTVTTTIPNLAAFVVRQPFRELVYGKTWFLKSLGDSAAFKTNSPEAQFNS